jgi:hypothetical protein
MKIDPLETAMDARVLPSSRLVESTWNTGPGATTVATPSSFRK